jgi:hypothetical protein
LLGRRALAAAPGVLPASFEAAVEGAARANHGRALALYALAEHVVGRLEAAGIRALPLKGPFLSRRVHGDYASRMVNDLDLLVDRARLDEAVAVVSELGYRADPLDHDGPPELHHTMRDPAGRLARIELHRRIHWYEDEFSRHMLERSERGSDGFLEARPDDELASLLLYYARDGFYGLRAAADVAAWWDVHGPTVSAPPLERHWELYPALRRPLAAAAAAAERLVGLPAARVLPGGASRRPRRARLAIRVGSWTGVGEYDQLASDITLVDVLLSPPGGLLAALRRHVLLPPGRVETTYGLPAGRSMRRAGWRLLHPPKMAARYMLGVWGAMRQTCP